MHRCWHHVLATKVGSRWTAKLPLHSADKPLWVYANVVYPLDDPVTGAGYYYGIYTAKTFNVSSLLQMETPDDLKTAGVRAALKPSPLIEDFQGDWEKEWFTYRPAEWARVTHKIYDDTWKAPENAKLALKVRAAEANKLVVMIDGHAAEMKLVGGTQWQDVVLSPDDFQDAAGEPLPSWESLSAQDKDELDFRRAIYAAQIDRLDQNIGRLVDRLHKLGILDKTLILFMSDNGCSGEFGKFGMNWGEYRRENYSQWRKKSGPSISQGQCWASYSNTPFRKYKIFVHEGGIATPFIAHWPAGIGTPGRIYGGQVFHLMDVMPTLCEVADIEYPASCDGRDIIPMQGISMLPHLAGTQAKATARTLCWQHETNAAIREGNWKLVTENDRVDDKWELYDLSTDRSETEDLGAEQPEVVQRLKQKWRNWAKETDVVPFPEQRGDTRRIPLPRQ